jgi:hypothetical protein
MPSLVCFPGLEGPFPGGSAPSKDLRECLADQVSMSSPRGRSRAPPPFRASTNVPGPLDCPGDLQPRSGPLTARSRLPRDGRFVKPPTRGRPGQMRDSRRLLLAGGFGAAVWPTADLPRIRVGKEGALAADRKEYRSPLGPENHQGKPPIGVETAYGGLELRH